MNVDVIHVHVNDSPDELDLAARHHVVADPRSHRDRSRTVPASQRSGRVDAHRARRDESGVKPSKLADAIERLSIFGAGAIVGTDVLVLRRYMPALPDRHVRRIAARCDSAVAA